MASFGRGRSPGIRGLVPSIFIHGKILMSKGKLQVTTLIFLPQPNSVIRSIRWYQGPLIKFPIGLFHTFQILNQYLYSRMDPSMNLSRNSNNSRAREKQVLLPGITVAVGSQMLSLLAVLSFSLFGVKTLQNYAITINSFFCNENPIAVKTCSC